MLHDILLVLFGLIVGLVIGFIVARTMMKRYMKKNPPINEEMIKGLMMQMGRKKICKNTCNKEVIVK